MIWNHGVIVNHQCKTQICDKRKLTSFGPETSWRDMLVTFFLNWNKIKDTLKAMKSQTGGGKEDLHGKLDFLVIFPIQCS